MGHEDVEDLENRVSVALKAIEAVTVAPYMVGCVIEFAVAVFIALVSSAPTLEYEVVNEF